MTAPRFNFHAIALVALFIFCATTAAHAQTAQRTFVSTQGNDANTASLCSRNAPCRGFAAAISVVTAGGEVVALDSGGYGVLSITKSVQLVAPTGVYAAITATTGAAITINVGTSDTVVLRGLILNGLGAQFGVNFETGRTLHVEGCVINGFSATGIIMDRSITNNRAEIFIKDTVVRNGGASGIFLRSGGSGSLAQVSVDRCRFERNAGIGMYVFENTRATVRDSVAANNGFGLGAQTSTAGQTAEMNVENCTVTNSTNNGLTADGSDGAAIMRVSHSTITDNNTGISAIGNAQVLSRSNNTVEGNASGNDFPAGSTYTSK